MLKGFEHEEKGGAVDVASNTSEVRNHTDIRKKGSFFSKVMSKETLKKLENFFTKDDE